MSYDDNNRPNDPRDRGAYTPPTDDDLPFNRGFDARRPPAAKAPPITLIISAAVLLALIVAVVLYYRSGLRASTDAPAAVGTPVGPLTVDAPIEAQPIDPEEGVGLYRDGAAPSEDAPVFVPPPEAVQPRPAPQPLPPAEEEAAPPVRATPPAPRPTPAPAPAPTPAPTPAPAPSAGGATAGSSAVQIGAFASTAAADREYASLAGRYPQYARVAQKRVQEVTTSTGTTVYRTTFTGLSRDSAQAFCAAIKSGGGDCLVR